MCLYPRIIRNKRYLGYNIRKPKQGAATAAPCDDYRKLYVAIGCGNCYECKRQKAQQWRVRLTEELKVQKHAYFVTLTFSNESLIKLCKEFETTENNGIASAATRRFLERWRKIHKKSLRHWLITELGHEGTERIHMHGILFPEDELTKEKLERFWQYGMCHIGDFCNLQTINYIVKYVTKIDTDHKDYKADIFCSAGIGKAFTETLAAKNTYKYKPRNSAEFYTLDNGRKVALPIYYRNKLYTQEEREKMWTDRLDKNEIFVNGVRVRNINTQEGYKHYTDLLKTQQEWNTRVGYGSTANEWQEKEYNINFKQLQTHERKD